LSLKLISEISSYGCYYAYAKTCFDYHFASRPIGVLIFSERELTFTFVICYRPSDCLSSVCLSSVTLVRPTQAVQIFGNISTALVPWPSVDIHGKFYGDRPIGGVKG